MRFLAGAWEIEIQEGFLRIENMRDGQVSEMYGKLIGFSARTKPGKFAIFEPTAGSRLFFRVDNNVFFISPPLTNVDEWARESYLRHLEIK